MERERVWLLDSTMRDGAQGKNISFSVLYTLFGEFVGRRLRRRGLAPAGEEGSPPPLEGRAE